MRTIKKAPDDFKCHDRIISAFSNLGYSDLNDLSDGDVKETFIRNTLFTLGIKEPADAYKGLLIPNIANELTYKVDQKEIVVDVLAVACYLSFAVSSTEVITREKIIVRFKAFMAKGSGEAKSKTSLKVGNLPTFSGDDSDWLIWKERAEAQFKIDGLYKCLHDPLYAAAHEIENVAVHGMLTKTLLENSTSGHFACLMNNKDNGYKAWKHLCEYYECDVQIQNILRELCAKLEELKLTELTGWKNYVEDFMALKNRIEMFAMRAKEIKLKNVNSFMVDDWKKKFLAQIHVSALNSRMDFCSKDDSMDLWHTILDLKAFIHEKHLPIKKARAKQPKQTTQPKEENTSPVTEVKTKQGKEAKMLQSVYNQINAISDDKLKQQVRDLMAKAKSASSSEKTVKFSGKKRKHYRRTVESSDKCESSSSINIEANCEVDVDAGALNIWRVD